MASIRCIRLRIWSFFITLLFSLVLLPTKSYADDYEDAWKALNKNDRETAKKLLLKATSDPKRAVDAYTTLIYLLYFEGKESEATTYFEKLMELSKEPYIYAFALWNNEAAIGGYGKKSKDKLKLIEKMLVDPRANASVKASLHYTKAYHFLAINKYADAIKEWAAMGTINKWQFTGPFDNISSSGFDKDYAPIAQPEPTAKFVSANNATIAWFTPTPSGNQSWTYPSNFIRESNTLVYAQSFITAPNDMEALLCAGFGGNIKVWVNDKLILSEQEEFNTDIDVLKAPCSLKKGVNRVLLQIGNNATNAANFAIRITDQNLASIQSLTFSDVYQPYPKDKGSYDKTKVIPFEPEVLFTTKIKEEPENLINYYLLSEVYLKNRKYTEAQKVTAEGLAKAPDNSIFKYAMMQCLVKVNNRTELVQLIEDFKEKDPTCIVSYELRIDQLIQEEKYEDALALVEEQIKKHGVSTTSIKTKINLAIKQEKLESGVQQIQEAYNKYPDDVNFVNMWYNVVKKLYKDPQRAIGVYENYLDDNFNSSVLEDLAGEYFELGSNNKGVKALEKLSATFPHDPDYLTKLVNHHYSVKDYDKAMEYAQKCLKISPYNAGYWENLGLLYEQDKNEKEAIAAYRQGLHYNPNAYDVRKKLQILENKIDMLKMLPNTNGYDLIKASKIADKEGKHDWYYVLDEKTKIVYEEGTSEEYFNMAIKVVSEKGIDYWKETSISYNYYKQRLVIEKAEVVKKNGSKITAERNDNQLVFPNLEKGDAVHFKYKIESYARGRLAKEFWDSYWFNGFMPVEQARYTLIVSNKRTFDYTLNNSTIKPTIVENGEFKIYTWEMNNEVALKEESKMPNGVDICKILHISSIKNWQEIADWYSDVSSAQAKFDYEVEQVYKTIFPTNEALTETQKARKIYDYIVKNITYSSVSFRQSAYIPQKASKTLHTKLGDCKDLSTLYATFARQAGLESNVVLISTKDNGLKGLLLPSPDFNHCIAKVKADGKWYYLELTDAYTPFASLPPSDVDAMRLDIPHNKDITKANLEALVTPLKVSDQLKRKTTITVDKNDFNVASKCVKRGYLTASTRYRYGTLNKEKQMEELRKGISSDYKNPVTMKDVNYTLLDVLQDSVVYDYSYSVKNEVIEIGELKTFKVPYSDIFVRADHFIEEERKFPISYWKYEDTDEYLEEMTIQLPAGKLFIEIPKDVELSFNGTKYKLTFKKVSPTLVKIYRSVKINKADIPTADYLKFKQFVNDVTAIEGKYIAFK